MVDMVIGKSVLFELSGQVGWIKLNRPKALNSLDYEMVIAIYQKLNEWKESPEVKVIGIEGEGEKAFCAGGDMVAFYNRRYSTDDYPLQFFQTEYQMDLLIHNYPKPVVALVDGYVMGGGVGIAAGASHRIVTEKTKWSMPEMNIGFFPDVGASYFLNQMPGYIGRYLALTSQLIKGNDLIYVGAADYYVTTASLAELKAALSSTEYDDQAVNEEVNRLIEKFSKQAVQGSQIMIDELEINQHFCFDSLEQIMDSLKNKALANSSWEKETLLTLQKKPPTSLKVALKQNLEGEGKTIFDCLKMELELSLNFMEHADFYEGVRAVLVDKDHAPMWNPSQLQEVSDRDVAKFFEYNWSNGNPLKEEVITYGNHQ
ncbi:enoyl-CoA hydratase/isomerase family protein [Radiobacillus sp. PE A8.2]|uniref:enoyl-CoA hydratase/isomerase family protein n=1 Tax=Radiobacillus sp. PE A8.2 TaxID=3380349 RepID=UPI00388CFA0C